MIFLCVFILTVMISVVCMPSGDVILTHHQNTRTKGFCEADGLVVSWVGVFLFASFVFNCLGSVGGHTLTLDGDLVMLGIV